MYNDYTWEFMKKIVCHVNCRHLCFPILMQKQKLARTRLILYLYDLVKLALVVTIFESLDVLNAAKTMVAGLRNSFNAVVQKSLELKHSPYLE